MEPPAVFDADNVRDERAKLLRRDSGDEARRSAALRGAGQYGPARDRRPGSCRDFARNKASIPNRKPIPMRRSTFFVDNWRWAGVPFYIRSGKRLPKRVTDIAIQFNAPPLAMFQQETRLGPRSPRPNLLILRIQPEEGISLRFFSKSPGSGMRVRPVSMDFNYGSSFGERSPSAYETLLVDAMSGDPTLYTRQDMVEASWQVVQPIIDVWQNTTFDFPNYEAGTWGPKEADEMLARQGHVWRVP